MAYDKLADGRMGEPSEKVRARVEAVREKQRLHFLNTGLTCNADTRSGPADVRNKGDPKADAADVFCH